MCAVMQNYDERYGGMLGCRTGKLLASLQKLTQTRTSLLVPRLLGGPDVCGPRTPSAPHDAVQTPGTYPLSSPDRQGQPGTHTLYNPVAVVHIPRPECAEQSADPLLLPPHDFRQALQG